MENLQNVIEKTEQEIKHLRTKRQKSEIEQFSVLDKEILRLEMLLKHFKESEHLQELREKGHTHTDTFTLAKLHAMEILSQAINEGKDINGNDPRIIASFRLTDIIERLELLQMAKEPKDTAFQPAKYFTEQFNSYIKAKNEKVESAKTRLSAQDREIQRIETALKDARMAGNPEEIIEYSDSLETACKTREYLEPMVLESEQSETFPPETISNAWKEICNLYRHEWLLRLEIINTAQEIHHQACNELIDLTNSLKSLRYEIQRIGRENGSPDEIEKYNQQITSGIDINRIRQIPPNENDRLYRYIYHDRGKLL